VRQRIARRFVSALLVALLGNAGSGAAQPAGPEAGSLAWLRGQIVPNAAFPSPDPMRRSLILSYAPAGRPAGPIHRKSFAYDAALAAIAFSTTGDLAAAASILHALVRVQRDDGTFWFSYAVDVAWPTEADHDMGLVRSGANAWVGQALTFYLERLPAGNASLEREREHLLSAARRIADALLGMRVADSSPARGLVRGGRAIVRLEAEPGRSGVREVYDDRPVEWISTEHNLIAWFFLKSLHGLTGEARYETAASAIQARLLERLWQEDLGQFAQGLLEDGRIDRRLALDCASWGALFLLAVGERERAVRSAQTADRRYVGTDAGVTGHRPYSNQPVYDDPVVQRRLLPKAPAARWEGNQFVWSEGSLGVALAFARLGDASRARAIVAEVLKLRADGGIRYASHSLPFEFAADPSVAATAWHVIVEEALRLPAAPGLWWR
jgi:hypothetical protein